MALIDCPECMHKISDQSNSCPNCGFLTHRIRNPKDDTVSTPVKKFKVNKPDKGYKQASFKQVMIVIIGAFLFFYFFIKSDHNEEIQATAFAVPTEATESAIEIETTAEKMIATYKANEVKGDAIYKDKRIKIVGTVDSISSGLSDKATVLLSSGKKEFSFTNVHASGDSDFHNRAINLNKGDVITLVCTGDGEVIGSPFLKDCRF